MKRSTNGGGRPGPYDLKDRGSNRSGSDYGGGRSMRGGNGNLISFTLLYKIIKFRFLYKVECSNNSAVVEMLTIVTSVIPSDTFMSFMYSSLS